MADLSNIPGQHEYSDLLYAYSIGCLDKEDLLQLTNFIETGNEFPSQELGEYQNLAALLPSILNMETPGPEIKDKVARKLYRIKNERLPSITSESIRKEQAAVEVKHNILIEGKTLQSDSFEHTGTLKENLTSGDEGVLKNDQLKQNLQTDTSSNLKNVNDEFLTQKTSAKILSDHINIPITDEIDTKSIEINEVSNTKQKTVSNADKKKSYHLHGISGPRTEKKGKGGIILIIILFLIIFLGLIYFYQRISFSVNTYRGEIDKLNKQVSNLSEQVAVNKEVEKILQMRDAHIINLYGSSLYKEGFGKIIISFESSSGLLQLSNMPVLNNGKSYQVWMTTEGHTNSLRVLNPVDNKYYFPISLPVQNYKGEIRFIVTEESSEGSQMPSNKVYLTGILQ
jgi:hypothetical protein